MRERGEFFEKNSRPLLSGLGWCLPPFVVSYWNFPRPFSDFPLSSRMLNVGPATAFPALAYVCEGIWWGSWSFSELLWKCVLPSLAALYSPPPPLTPAQTLKQHRERRLAWITALRGSPNLQLSTLTSPPARVGGGDLVVKEACGGMEGEDWGGVLGRQL